VALIERVQPGAQPVAENDGLSADRFRDGGVLTLGVARDIDPATEWQRPGVERLGEAGLPGADDAGEDHVRCGDDAPPVQLPRVVDEAPAGVHVLPDEHALAAEATFGEERILSRQHRTGVLMARKPKPARCPERRRTRLAGPRKVRRGPPLRPLSLGLRLGCFDLGTALLGNQPGGGLSALLAVLAPL